MRKILGEKSALDAKLYMYNTNLSKNTSIQSYLAVLKTHPDLQASPNIKYNNDVTKWIPPAFPGFGGEMYTILPLR